MSIIRCCIVLPRFAGVVFCILRDVFVVFVRGSFWIMYCRSCIGVLLSFLFVPLLSYFFKPKLILIVYLFVFVCLALLLCYFVFLWFVCFALLCAFCFLFLFWCIFDVVIFAHFVCLFSVYFLFACLLFACFCTYGCCLIVCICCLLLFVCSYILFMHIICVRCRCVWRPACVYEFCSRCARHVCSWWARVCGGLLLPLCSYSRCARYRDVFPLCSCARGRGRGVVVFWSCARGCRVLALCSYLSCARVVCARARGVFALCSCLFRARVVFVFVVRSRCARVCCVLTLCLCLLFSHVALVSWCARVELVLVMCSCCARTRDVLVLCSCSCCARVVSHLQNMHWPLGFASFPLVFLSLSANTPHCTHANAFAPIRSRPHLFWFFFVKHDVRGNFPGHWDQIMSFGPLNAPCFPCFAVLSCPCTPPHQ